ncbi:TPA: BREX protein BrxB domain-containing protein, partial [Escherichia coli]
DYPAQCELQVREHLKYLLRHLEKDHKFACLNVFQIIINMLNERGLFERVCQQEVKVGTETLKKQLAGPLNQKKIADFIAKKVDLAAQDFVILTGMGNAWPLVRGHELM